MEIEDTTAPKEVLLEKTKAIQKDSKDTKQVNGNNEN